MAYKYKLNDGQRRVLGKGLNYAVTPDKLPVEEFVVDTEQACRSLPIDKADQVAVSILKSAKLPKSNITKKERQALVELTKKEHKGSTGRQVESNSNNGD